MDFNRWFSRQLQASADGFVWAVNEVPEARRYVSPPKPFGEWSVARHVFHMLYYERECALPSMRQWLGEPLLDESLYNEDGNWSEDRQIEMMLTEFQAIRAKQIAILTQFDPTNWEEARETVWGQVPLKWVVGKTFQHTAEHTNDVGRMALFWDFFLARQQTDAEKSQNSTE